MSRKRPTPHKPARPENERDPLDEIRRAALDLRGTDPAEAVRVLRRVLKAPGDYAPLAHGALAEILLDEFQDGDGASHHFAEVVKAAPRVASAHLGLARARAASGDPDGAHAAYAETASLLSAQLADTLAALEKATEDAPPADDGSPDADAGSLLDVLIEDRQLREEEARDWTPLAFDRALFTRLEAARAFDDDADDTEFADWATYALRLSRVVQLDTGLDAALAETDRVAALAPLPDRLRHETRALLFEFAGDTARAADAAFASLADGTDVDPDAALHAAELLVAAGRKPDANSVLERALKGLEHARAQPDLPAEIRAEFDALRDTLRKALGELAAPGLVGLGGLSKKTGAAK